MVSRSNHPPLAKRERANNHSPHFLPSGPTYNPLMVSRSSHPPLAKKERANNHSPLHLLPLILSVSKDGVGQIIIRPYGGRTPVHTV